MSSVQINYKSGARMVVKAKSVNVESIGGTLSKVEWNGLEPRPLFIGIGDIESIWEL